MKKTSISELKASLSEYLAQVEKGQEVIVTDRQRPVAKLVPFKVEGAHKRQRIDLAKQGLVQLGTGKISGEFLKPSPVRDPSGSVLKALREEREEGD